MLLCHTSTYQQLSEVSCIGSVHERNKACGRSERIFEAESGRGRRCVGREPHSGPLAEAPSLHARARQVPAAPARAGAPRAARPPRAAAAQQVPPQDGQRARAQQDAGDQPRLRDAAPGRARLGSGRRARAVRETHQDLDAAAGHALHHGAVRDAARRRQWRRRLAPRSLVLALLLRPVGVVDGTGARDALGVRGGLALALRLLLRRVRVRVRGPNVCVTAAAAAAVTVA